MGKNIIVAEKPSVGREYAKVLGVTGTEKNGYMENDRWIVTWTIGHLITMSYPEKYDASLKEWKLETLPFLPEEYIYEPIKKCYKQFLTIKNLYNRPDIDAIYYAGDSGREGLYIQMLVRQFAGHNSNAVERVVWIDSQTEDEIMRGISEAKELKEYEKMSDSGYMRAIEDYATGINFSRLLSVKYAVMLNSGSGQKKRRPISVGRVMSCVLGMIVKREREIRNFKVTNFYRIISAIDLEGYKIECEWKAVNGSSLCNSPKLYSEFGFLNRNDAEEFMGTLPARIKVENIVKTIEKKNAPLLFNLAELQSEGTKNLHLSPAETLKIAQSLYEKRLITYPRTDARVLTNAIANEIEKNLHGLEKSIYGEYLSAILKNGWSLKGKYIDDSKVTDHYAIIPTGVIAGDLSEQEENVYDMICRRFLAVFYPPAEFERIKIEASCAGEKFFGNSKCICNEGFYSVSGIPEFADNKESLEKMTKLQQGMEYSCSYEIREGRTEPPKRYTSGSMILAMENAGNLIEDDELREQIKNNGIGTSATRAEVLEKLLRLNYIAVNEKKQVLTPTKFGEMVYEVLLETIPSMLQPEMTAKWEKGLQQIEEGTIKKQDYQEKLYDFIREECKKIKENDNKSNILKKIRPYASQFIQCEYKEFDPYNTRIKCPLCGDDVETTSWGFKCKSNVSKTEGCSFSIGDILGHRLLTNELALLLHDGIVGPFYDFISSKGKKFGANLIWDDNSKKVVLDVVDMPWTETDINCPICHKKVMARDSFYKCEDYIDRDHGCNFFVGKILGKTIPQKQIEKLVKEGRTDLLSGFKKEDGNKFDAFLTWNDSEKRIGFQFPDTNDIATNYKCPICQGRIVSTPYGFKCEKYKAQADRQEGDCSFYAGSILGHMIKEKELKILLNGGITELVSFKNADKKKFEGRLFWNRETKRIEIKFDEDRAVELNVRCPLCGNMLMKNHFGYFCSNAESGDQNGCQFRIGSIAGVHIDEKQLGMLLNQGKTDLISGFQPKEKGKKPFSAFLKWDSNEKKIIFEFPDQEALKETSKFMCPVCRKKKLLKSQYNYSCDCGFKLPFVIASKEIPEQEITKLLLRGESDFITGFYSARTRRMFAAKLVLNGNKIDFVFPDFGGGK